MIDRETEHHLGTVGHAIARVSTTTQCSLLGAVDERAGRVDEHELQCLGEQISVLGEELRLQRFAYVGEEAGFRLEPEYVASRPGDVRDSLASIDAARALIGYEPSRYRKHTRPP